jgi:predicted TIM-barrel fold metal-dependent hydrolase
MIIDFHIHVARHEDMLPWTREWIGRAYAPGELAAYLNTTVTTEGLRTLLRDNGVDYGVILAELNPMSSSVVPNEFVAALSRGESCLIPFATINPFLTTDLATELDRLVGEMGFRGLKLYPPYQHFYPNDNRLYPIYARAQRLGIPVMFHTGSSVFKGVRLKYADPLLLDDVAVDFPDLKIIMAHSGRGAWYTQAYLLARLRPNVYMEVAGLPPQKLLDYFPDLERVADKVIFGSDWPEVRDIRRNIETVRALPLRDETKEKILGLNAAQVLGLS